MGQGTDGFRQGWKNLKTCEFPLFSLVGPVLKKVQKEQTILLLFTSARQSQASYPCLLQISIKNPTLLPKWPKLLKNLAGENLSLIPRKVSAVVRMTSIRGKFSRYRSV